MRPGFRKVFRYHGWRGFDVRVEGQEPRFRNSRQVRLFLHVQDQDGGSLASLGKEVGCFRFLLLEYGANRGEAIFLGSGVPSLDWKGDLQAAAQTGGSFRNLHEGEIRRG